MARKVDISELYSIFLLKSNSLLKFEYVSNEAPFFSQDVYVWAPYSAFLSTQNGPFHVMSATTPPPLPLRYREMKGSQAKEVGCRNNEYICTGKEMHFALLL